MTNHPRIDSVLDLPTVAAAIFAEASTSRAAGPDGEAIDPDGWPHTGDVGMLERRSVTARHADDIHALYAPAHAPAHAPAGSSR